MSRSAALTDPHLSYLIPLPRGANPFGHYWPITTSEMYHGIVFEKCVDPKNIGKKCSQVAEEHAVVNMLQPEQLRNYSMTKWRRIGDLTAQPGEARSPLPDSNPAPKPTGIPRASTEGGQASSVQALQKSGCADVGR